MIAICIDYTNEKEFYFTSPQTWTLWAIIDLHDYLMYFLINVLIVVVVFSVIAIFHQQSYFWQSIYPKISTADRLLFKIKISYIKMYNEFKLQTFNHAPWIEFFWTITPTLMLIFMGWPSFKVLYAIEQLIDPIHTISVIGNQWYRTYCYSDFDIVSDLVKQLDSNNFLDNYIKEAFYFNSKTDSINSLFLTFKAVKLEDVFLFEETRSAKKLRFETKLTNNSCILFEVIMRFSEENAEKLIQLLFNNKSYISSNSPIENIENFCKLTDQNFSFDEEIFIIDNNLTPIFYLAIEEKNNINSIHKIIDKKNLIQVMSKYLRNFEESKIIYDCVILSDENLPKGYPRLLSTDQVLILPAFVSVRILVTSVDVIHSWALPSHGIKMDAIPGRINQISFLTQTVGTYWGQCSELCGINHGFMPIEVRVLLLNDYLSYVSLNISYRQDKLILVAEKFVYAYMTRQLENLEKSIFFSISEDFLY